MTAYYLTRGEISAFLPDARAQQRFDLMQRTVTETKDTVTTNVSDTKTIREAAYLTLSANAELPNERVFRWGAGLTLTIGNDTATLKLTTEVPRSSGGYTITLVGEGDSSVAVPLTGRLATTQNSETLENKTLVAPSLSAPKITGLGDYANDAAAAAAGIPVGGVYRTASALMIRAA